MAQTNNNDHLISSDENRSENDMPPTPGVVMTAEGDSYQPPTPPSPAPTLQEHPIPTQAAPGTPPACEPQSEGQNAPAAAESEGEQEEEPSYITRRREVMEQLDADTANSHPASLFRGGDDYVESPSEADIVRTYNRAHCLSGMLAPACRGKNAHGHGGKCPPCAALTSAVEVGFTRAHALLRFAISESDVFCMSEGTSDCEGLLVGTSQRYAEAPVKLCDGCHAVCSRANAVALARDNGQRLPPLPGVDYQGISRQWYLGTYHRDAPRDREGIIAQSERLNAPGTVSETDLPHQVRRRRQTSGPLRTRGMCSSTTGRRVRTRLAPYVRARLQNRGFFDARGRGGEHSVMHWGEGN